MLSSQGTVTPGADALRVRQIFRYLAEASESRVKPVRSLDQARQLLWLADLPYEAPELQCFLAAPLDGDEPRWLVVRRPGHRDLPEPGGLLRAWLEGVDLTGYTAATAPRLRDEIEVPEDVLAPDGSVEVTSRKLRREDVARPAKLEAEYVAWAAAWTAWAAWKRASVPVSRLYESLYRTHEDATTLGESFELVLCLGLLTWSAGDEPIRRHLLTARAVLELDPHTGVLTLRPDPDAPGFSLEESMLDAGQKSRSEAREHILRLLEDAGSGTEPGELEQLHQALDVWTISAHQAGRYLRQQAPHRSSPAADPRVSFAPAVLLRERSRRTNIEALHGIARAVEQGGAPTELLSFIAGDEAQAGWPPADGRDEPAGGRAAETYFALASNEEQRTIADRLRSSRLVVVQGPPGTGKTHTIANLVTDLLAHGQRVLITSHTARALKVLKDKLPASIRELCVSRTDDGLVAQQELRGSVQAILERQGSYDPDDYRRRIAGHEQKLHSARTAQAHALGELRAIREQETYRHPPGIGDYRGTLQEIARRLSAEQPALGWLGVVPAPAPGIAPDGPMALLDASRAFGREARVATDGIDALPEPGELLGPTAFEQAVAAVQNAENGLSVLRGNASADGLDESVSRLDPAAQETAAAALEAFVAARARAESRLPDWAGALLEEALTGQDWQLRGRHGMTTRAWEGAQECSRQLAGGRVDGLEAYDLATALARATALRDGLAAGDKLRGPLGMRTRLRKAVDDFPDRVRIDGAVPDTVAAATRVLLRVELERHLQDVEREWGAGAEPWQAPSRRLAGLEAQAMVLQLLAELADRRAELVAALAAVPVLTVKPWNRPETCDTAAALFRAHAALRTAEVPGARLAELEQTLVGWADRPATAAALLARLLGAVQARACAEYRAIVQELLELRAGLDLKAAFRAAYGPVAQVLPALARDLEERPEDPHWDTRLPDFERAWAWSVWTARMRELTDPAAEERQRALLAEADGDIRITLEKLAADRSWHGCLQRLTDAESVALTSYQQSLGRFGKGTGKYAHRYRMQARESLRECQGAVPAWIMPLYQVTATVPMEDAGRFDVVIIDEASQSGPEALLLAWLGKKIIVVGDDKQVSPANVGLDQDQLFQLQNRLLDALPAYRRNVFSPTASFFDIATALAGGWGKLMLQEHFRCMPEIIGFSNELSYNGRLQPLRQYGADRLPPIRTVHVPGAYIEGTGQRQRNRAEAERLVAEMVRCCADPAYQGRTMGVITLLGSGQRQEIEDLLTERLPVDERQRRKIRVGDAEDFQGDERDIVFISLVVSLAGEDGPRRPGPFASEAMQQRLNVAASRARDQVWLFHSVTSTELGPNDLRRRYLDYCTRPAEEQDGFGLDDVGPDVRHEAFDSLFEQRVFLALRGRRFRVRPQYPVGRYRIDLVVEGGTRRLAVECDGDAFHNEENADADAARQRELERVGWTFVRIRGSRFFLDPDRALEPLWAELAQLGIEPEGAGGGAVAAAPVPAPVPVPAQRPAPAVDGATPRPVDGGGSPQRAAGVPRQSFPVTAVSVNSYRRVQRELRFLEDRLGAPAEFGVAVDAAALTAQRAGQARARARDEARRDFLRDYLDVVMSDPRLPGGEVVVPGALVGVEHEDEPGAVRYSVSTMATTEAERISPRSALGQALLWCETGEHFSYRTESGGTARAVVRFVED